MSPLTIVLLVILVILIGVLIAMYFYGRKLQKRQDEAQVQMEANKQTVSMLIIDKKKLKLKESGLPQAVIDSTPWLYRRYKVPVVKAKVGPQILSLVSEESIFDQIPVTKNVKAVVSGIYITDIKELHGARTVVPQKKKGFFGRAMDRLKEFGGAGSVK